MTLAEWIAEYRRVDPDEIARPEVDAVDDWANEELMAPADRLRDEKPRWMERARIVGYGPPGWR